MSFFLKSSFRHLIIYLIILIPVMFCLYFCFDLLGLSFLKIKSALLQTGLRALFRLGGWECLGPVMILLCVVSGLGGSTLHMMDPSGSSGSTNSEGGGGSNQSDFWSNFYIDVLLEPFSGTQSSGTGSVNKPSEGMPVPPANPVGEQAGPENPELPEENFHPSDVIGGDSIESIKERLLSSNLNPSPDEIRFALYDAEDLFRVKVEIIRGMTPLDPEGDWPGRGARALENPRTSTSEDSIDNLYRLRDGVLSGDAEIIRLLKDRMVFRRADYDASSQN